VLEPRVPEKRDAADDTVWQRIDGVFENGTTAVLSSVVLVVLSRLG
jgi:hypothetical protein